MKKLLLVTHTDNDLSVRVQKSEHMNKGNDVFFMADTEGGVLGNMTMHYTIHSIDSVMKCNKELEQKLAECRNLLREAVSIIEYHVGNDTDFCENPKVIEHLNQGNK